MRKRLKKWVKRTMACALVLTLLGSVTLAVLWMYFPFPMHELRQWPQSPRVTDRTGRPMVELVGHDDQWRVPVSLEKISDHAIDATIAVEDERFYTHPGVDPLAVARASWQNVRERRIVSGASTLTMQVCRMMRDRPRTFRAKAIESFRALQLEARCSKDEILEYYLNLAPYGGNRRGIEAAARYYFDKSAADLSLAEAALLAGIPQSPAAHNPKENPEQAKARRNKVLQRMHAAGYITKDQRDRASGAPLRLRTPTETKEIPHAAWLALRRRPQGGRTTLDPRIQRELQRTVQAHASDLPDQTDIAVVVIDIERGELVGMVGSANIADPLDGQVNGALAQRSPGSALKPFVYAAAIEAGRLGPETTLYDVSIYRAGWDPENFDHQFHGKVAAGDALRRSLNIPAILIAEQIGLRRCIGVMEAAGLRLPGDVMHRGGLAVVTGGVEVTLLRLTNAYATIGRDGRHRPVKLFVDESTSATQALSARSCQLISHMLSTRKQRPRGLDAIKPANVPWFMWKTGTSSGRRDAWAVGHNGDYAVGVWVGRFSGDADVAFVGARAAEPVLADLFTSDVLRASDAPSPPAPYEPPRPLSPPPEAQRPTLAITWPRDGAQYVAVQDQSVELYPRRSGDAPVHWFLNGQRLSDARVSDGIELSVGRHHLLCITDAGRTASARFTITAP